jgi:hypothetical protein
MKKNVTFKILYVIFIKTYLFLVCLSAAAYHLFFRGKLFGRF